MGAEIGKDCSCSGVCAPEDPSVADARYDSKTNQRYPHTAGHHPSGPAATTLPPASRSAHEGNPGLVQRPAVADYGGGEEEQETFFIPPPESDFEPAAASARGDPASRPPGAASPPPARPNPRAGGAGKALSFDQVLRDLEGAEISTYGGAFAELAGDQAVLYPDHAALRDFLAANSAVPAAEVDTELLKIASQTDSFSIDCDGLLTLLRENSVSEGDALQQFMTLSSDGESLAGEDCRSGLLHLVEEKLGSRLRGIQTERIFDAVMVDVGLTVNMEQWIQCSRRVARIVRLMRYAGVSD